MSKAPIQIERAIKQAYKGPVKTLIKEGQSLREKAYPAFFGEFANIGTGAGDMSPAAALQAAMTGGERAMSPYRTNLGLRDYYDTLVNDLVGKGLQAYQMGYGGLKDLYSMEFSREQAARAATRARSGSSGGGFNLPLPPSASRQTTPSTPAYYANPKYGDTPYSGLVDYYTGKSSVLPTNVYQTPSDLFLKY